MRTFVVKMNNSKPDINIKNLPGSGRYDLATRCISSALWISHGIREDTEIYIVLEPLKTVLRFTPDIEKLNPNERSIGLWMKKVLEGTHSNPGIEKLGSDFESLMEEFKGRKIYTLNKDGENYENIKLGNDPVFVLGDNNGLSKEDLDLLKSLNSESISLGEKEYITSNCIGTLNILCDNDSSL